MSASRKAIAKAVYELMGKATDAKQLAESIASYLIAERRTKDVNAIMRDVETLRLQRDGVLEANVTSARPLSDAAKQDIKALFDEAHIIIHEQQDASLLGGVKVRAYDKQIDHSVRARLQRLRSGAL